MAGKLIVKIVKELCEQQVVCFSDLNCLDNVDLPTQTNKTLKMIINNLPLTCYLILTIQMVSLRFLTQNRMLLYSHPVHYSGLNSELSFWFYLCR